MLDNLKTALLSTGLPVAHCEGFKNEPKYIVWQEIGKSTLRAGGAAQNAAWRVSVDYFTKSEYDTNVKVIENAFESIGACYDDCVCDYEHETGYTHYSWDCEVEDGSA